MDPTVQGRVQTDTVMDSRLVITQMGNVNQIVRLDGQVLTVQVPVEEPTRWVLMSFIFHLVISK